MTNEEKATIPKSNVRRWLRCFFGKHELVTIEVDYRTARCCKYCSYTEYMFLDGWHKVARSRPVEYLLKQINI